MAKEHIHLRSDPADVNRDVQVRCNAPVCWYPTPEPLRLSPFVRRALANELPAKEVQR